MSHAHHHLGADKVVKAEVPHASSDMNVTPLIDVLLVLLVIFMSVVNLTQQGVDINLPAETKKTTEATPDVSQIVLQYGADGRISVNKTDVALPELEKRLKDIFEQRKDKKMFLMAAGSLRYGKVIDVIDAAKGAGVEQVGIVTEGMQKAAGAGGN
jgi:biopolymer transport protein TolR